MVANVAGAGALDVTDRPARALGDVTSATLEAAVGAVEAALGPLATEAKLEAVRAQLAGTLSAAVTGTVDVGNLTGLATEATLVAVRTALGNVATDAKLEAVRAALVGTLTVDTGHTQPLTNTQLRANPVAVADGHPDPQLDGLTDAQLRATPVAVTDQHAQPLTDGQLRAAPVEVTGSLVATTPGLTDAELRAAPVDTRLAAGDQLVGYVSSNAVRVASLGRVFLGTSPRLSASLGQSVRATIANPAGSGVNVLVSRLVATSAAGGSTLAVGRVYVNPTTNTPTTAHTPTNAAIGGPASAVVFRVDTGSPMSGGTATDLYLGFAGGGRTEIDLSAPLILPPGVTLGLNLPLGTLEATDGTFAAYWIEEPLP